MNTHTHKTQENKTQSAANAVSQKQTGGESTFQFMDNRPEAIAQRKRQEMANNRPRVKQLRAFQRMANNSLHAKQAAQLQAHAYAQRTDIHLGPGQEKHLPHEAWHVVQQKQGRVRPTTQLKNKVNINEDKGLEKAADAMGENSSPFRKSSSIEARNSTVQRPSLNFQDGTSKSTPLQLYGQNEKIVEKKELNASFQKPDKPIQMITWKKEEYGWTPLYGDETEETPPGSHFGEIGQIYDEDTDTLYDPDEYREQVELPQVRMLHDQLPIIEDEVRRLVSENDIREYLSADYESEVIAYFIVKNLSAAQQDLILSQSALFTSLDLLNQVLDAIARKHDTEMKKKLIEEALNPKSSIILDDIGMLLSDVDQEAFGKGLRTRFSELTELRNSILSSIAELEESPLEALPRKCQSINRQLEILENEGQIFSELYFKVVDPEERKASIGRSDPIAITGTLGVMTVKALNSIPSPYDDLSIIQQGLSRITRAHGEEGIHIRTNGVVVYKFLGTLGNQGIYAERSKIEGKYVFAKKLTRRH